MLLQLNLVNGTTPAIGHDEVAIARVQVGALRSECVHRGIQTKCCTGFLESSAGRTDDARQARLLGAGARQLAHRRCYGGVAPTEH